MSDSLRESIANAKDFKEAEKQRVREIQHNANGDMEGRPSDEHYKPKFMDKYANGEGYLYNRFMRGWVDARQKEINGVHEKYGK